MKKIISFLILFVTISAPFLMLSSCSDENEESEATVIYRLLDKDNNPTNVITYGDKIAPNSTNYLFQHEYGHYIQSQHMGPLYLLTVGEPSLWNAKFGSKHDVQSYERDANYRAFKYFNEHLDNFTSSDWNFYKNPLTRDRYDMVDYSKEDLERVEHTLQKYYLWF